MTAWVLPFILICFGKQVSDDL
jgi:hypothetical protein